MEAHVRIDRGVKRGKRIKPSDLEREIRRQARNGEGNFLPVVPAEKRAEILQDALVMLQRGLTTDDVGAKYNVSGSVIRTWLIAAGEHASEARALFLSNILVGYADQMPGARDPLTLACAREAFSAWFKIAQVRDPKNFGVKQQIEHTVSADLGEVLRRARERVIDAPQQEAKSLTNQSPDSADSSVISED